MTARSAPATICARWSSSARTVRNLLQPLARKVGSLDVVEQAAIAGLLDPGAAR